MKRALLFLAVFALVALTAVLSVIAQGGAPLVDIPASGSDGVFAPVANVVVDLAAASDASWDAAPAASGLGVYDASKWAVVFKYESVSIPSDVTVRFANHPTRAPVVWIVEGDVTIDGEVNLNGERGETENVFAEPGPGGYYGGSNGASGSSGFGPGGSLSAASESAPTIKSGASYATAGGGGQAGPTYGAPELVPLLGGSGGAGSSLQVARGGAGGGALLVVAESITINGVVSAVGGTYRNPGSSGSGGAIRLVSRAIGGEGELRSHAPVNVPAAQLGGAGRIRLESETEIGGLLQTEPAASTATLAGPVKLWPEPDDPTARIVSIGGVPVGPDPRANLSHSPDVELASSDPVDIVVETTGVEIDPDTIVEVRITPREGPAVFVAATHTAGDETLSTWTAAAVTLPQTVSSLLVLVERP